MRILFTPHAVTDLEEAYDHYADLSPKLGTHFLRDVDAAIEWILTFPQGALPVEGFEQIRRVRMRKFPYGGFYRQAPEGDVMIVRVLHSRRQHADAVED